MGDGYRIGDDVKRVEAMTASFVKATVVTSLLLVLLAIWVRTPYLSLNPAAVVGMSGVTGFNVGHAIVFGPLLAFGFACVELTTLHRRGELMGAIAARLRNEPTLIATLTDGERQVLGRIDPNARCTLNDWISGGIAGFWFFVVPPLAALWCADRYLDFIPNEPAKAWSFWQRVVSHFLSGELWAMRPLIAEHHIESKLLQELPYIYSPLQAWVELAVTLATAVVCWRAASLFGARVEPGAAPVTGNSPS